MLVIMTIEVDIKTGFGQTNYNDFGAGWSQTLVQERPVNFAKACRIRVFKRQCGAISEVIGMKNGIIEVEPWWQQ